MKHQLPAHLWIMQQAGMYFAKRSGEAKYDWLGHSLDVAACMQQITLRHGYFRSGLLNLLSCDENTLQHWLVWAAVRHDLGKISKAFQRMMLYGDTDNYTVRHDTLGWAIWKSHLSNDIPHSLRRTADVLVRTTTGHHGSPPSEMVNNRPISTYPHFTDEDLEYCRGVLNRLDQVIPLPEKPLGLEGLKHATWWIAGATVVADWLASDTHWFPFKEVPDLPEQWQVSLSRARVALDESGIIQSPLQAPQSLEEIDLTWNLRPLQRAAQELDVSKPVCVVVEDAMGAGKTEAALILAGRLIGAGQAKSLFWALPTVATSNSLYVRLGDYCPDAQRTLTHGYPVKLHAEDATPWLLGDNRRRLFAPLSAGTVDQLMLAAMYAKFSVLRLMGLVGSVLVFDEIHAADGYMLNIITKLIELHAKMGGSVILLSATLPSAYREQLISAWRCGRDLTGGNLDSREYPVLVNGSHDDIEVKALPETSHKRIRVAHVESEVEVEQQLIDVAREGWCAVWVCSTVDESIKRYQSLKKTLGTSVSLFHSRFIADHRNDIESNVLRLFGKHSTPRERAGKILVATQVVEQSLDLDFDFMATDAAPVDLVFQRAGRLQRHDRACRLDPVLLIHSPKLDGDWQIAARFVYKGLMPHIWLSTKLLLDAGEINLPCDLRSMVETVYEHSGADTPLGPLIDPQESARANADLAAVTINAGYESKGRSWLPDTAFPTRLGEASRIVALVNVDGTPVGSTLTGSAIRFKWKWGQNDQFHMDGSWETVRLMGEQSYSKEIGLVLR